MRVKDKQGNWVVLSNPNLKYLGIFDERATIQNIEITGTYFNRL